MFGIRPDERRPVWAAFAFLTMSISSHAVLETARDALFLSRLPAAHLPFVYIAIAVISVALTRWESRLLGRLSHQTLLVGWSVLAGAGTLACHAIVPTESVTGVRGANASLYVLYVWSGVVIALTSVHLWSVLGESLSITQAKRLFPIVGAGSAIGALLGSGAAAVIAKTVGTHELLSVAGAGFSLSAVAALLLAGAGHGAQSRKREKDRGVLREAGVVARQPYLQRLALFTMVAAAGLTFVDYVYKSTAATEVPKADLAFFFGGVSFLLNGVSLALQIIVVPRMLRRLELGIALAVLPIALAAGGAGLVAGFGLGAALLAKGADGSLRYSLHRTATELLYLPLPDTIRPRIRATLDVLGQRFGQAVASLLILGIAATNLPLRFVASVFAVAAVLWVVSAFALRRPYVALLGESLKGGSTLRPGEFPELDVASLETLVAALDSKDDAEVLAAIDGLERDGKARLVPVLMLRHVSTAVVERALKLFIHEKRTNAVDAIDAILDHESPHVRRAAIAARALLAHDARLLYERLNLEESAEVRAAIVVHLIASGEIVAEEARQRIAEFVEDGDPSTKIALAEAIGSRDTHDLDQVVAALAEAPEPEVRVAAVEAMVDHHSPAYLPALVRALGSERTRQAARAALVRYGRPGFLAVRDALADRKLPQAVRWGLPRTLALFEPREAVRVLMDELGREPTGVLRYRIIRALETVVALNPDVKIDRAALDPVIMDTISRAFRRLDERTILERGRAEDPRRATPGHELLRDVLADKEASLRDRLLRLLGLAHPRIDFASIRRGLRSASPKTRASSIELAASVVDQRNRAAVGALLEDLPPEEKLAAAGSFHTPIEATYEELLETMLKNERESMQDIVAFHVAELRLVHLRPAIQGLADADASRGDVVRAAALLEGEVVPC